MSDNHLKIQMAAKAIQEADAVLIGSGAGLSTSAGFEYTGERFHKVFSNFGSKYGFSDMYSGGFYPYQSLEENWAYWSRYIYINRYMKPPKPVYEMLYGLVDGRYEGDKISAPKKDYFILNTNVDHQFQKAGFEKQRMFYTQGDYGLWQCKTPCHKRTYDNKDKVVKMVLSQGFGIGEKGELLTPEKENGETDFSRLKMTIPSDLVPYCPVCGEPMSMNLRADSTFVEDQGWHDGAKRYEDFVTKHGGCKMVYLELGVGYNTPGIIKYPFWQATSQNPKATYICINKGEAQAPKEIKEQSICIDGDIGEAISSIILMY